MEGHPELDTLAFEQDEPTPINWAGMQKYLVGEMAKTFNQHWGSGAHDLDYMSPRQVTRELCACRKVGANYVLNIGPTGTGAIPDHERATLGLVGRWTQMVGDVLYHGRTTNVQCSSRDFVLEHDGKQYLFVHDLRIDGDHNVVVAGLGGSGPRTLRKFDQRVKTIRWRDNDESLNFMQDVERGYLTIDCTPYPYGTYLVVRVVEIEV